MLTPRSIVACLLIGLWLPALLPAAEAELAPELRKMIEWLPADSETLLVAKGPFTFSSLVRSTDENEDAQPDPEERISLFRDSMRSTAAGGLLVLKIKELNEVLHDLTIERAIEGSRRFRSATDIGPWPYEGCRIIEFKNGSASSLNKAFATCEAHASAKSELNGHPVAVFERRFHQDDRLFYVCHPKPDVLLCATHRRYLLQVLERLEKPAETRAFPKELAEWAHVDVKASVWGLRHYRMDRAQKDPSIPLKADPGAIGFTFWLDERAKSTKARYLSKTEAANRIVSAHWNPSNRWLVSQVEQIDPGVIEISSDLPTETSAAVYLLFLMDYLGHGVNL